MNENKIISLGRLRGVKLDIHQLTKFMNTVEALVSGWHIIGFSKVVVIRAGRLWLFLR